MRKHVLSSALGLSIAASIFAVAPHAGATLWKNFATRDLPNPMFLVGSPTKGATARINTFDQLTDENVTLNPDGRQPGFNKLVTASSFPTLVLGVQGGNGNMNAGTPLITWSSTTDTNQDWRADFAFSDAQGAGCWILYNEASPPNRVFVMSVSGGTMVNGQPVVIWDYFADPANHPDQFWCRYKLVNGAIVPE